MASQGPVVVLDAGCGTGQAIHDLREIWFSQRPDLNGTLLRFNPPYDRIRGAGRTEAALFNRVKE